MLESREQKYQMIKLNSAKFNNFSAETRTMKYFRWDFVGRTGSEIFKLNHLTNSDVI